MREKLELNSEMAKVPAATPLPVGSDAGILTKFELVQVVVPVLPLPLVPWVTTGIAPKLPKARLPLAEATRSPAIPSQARAQRLAEGVGRFNDTGLDQHLTHRHVQLLDQFRHLSKAGRYVRNKQLVGTRLRNHAAARTQNARGRAAPASAPADAPVPVSPWAIVIALV